MFYVPMQESRGRTLTRAGREMQVPAAHSLWALPPILGLVALPLFPVVPFAWVGSTGQPGAGQSVRRAGARAVGSEGPQYMVACETKRDGGSGTGAASRVALRLGIQRNACMEASSKEAVHMLHTSCLK